MMKIYIMNTKIFHFNKYDLFYVYFNPNLRSYGQLFVLVFKYTSIYLYSNKGNMNSVHPHLFLLFQHNFKLFMEFGMI